MCFESSKFSVPRFKRAVHPKMKVLVLIFYPHGFFKPVRLLLFCETQKEFIFCSFSASAADVKILDEDRYVFVLTFFIYLL